MRKRLKRKRHSCAMCKGHKMGWWSRWKAKDEMLLRDFERHQINEAMRELQAESLWRIGNEPDQ